MAHRIDSQHSCCFTGHRPHRLPWGYRERDPRCRALKAVLAARIQHAYDEGARHFLCGMASGSDLYFCQAILSLRRHHPDVTLEAVLPCQDQTKYWPRAQKARWFRLLAQCDLVTVVQHGYGPLCMKRRNEYMVNRVTHLIALYDGHPWGGTFDTILYALERGILPDVIGIGTPESTINK